MAEAESGAFCIWEIARNVDQVNPGEFGWYFFNYQFIATQNWSDL